MLKILYGLLMMFVCTTAGCVTDNEPEGPSLQVGDPLPQFNITMNNGEVISTTSLIGKVSVIVFFNTDCSDCRKELPVIQELYDYYKGVTEVKIVAIAREEVAPEIEKYWEENGLTMPFSPQKTREIYSLFAPSIIPRIYISNTSGVITATFDDSDMPTFDALVMEINKYYLSHAQNKR